MLRWLFRLLGRHVRRRADHEPRALRLVLALPPLEPTFRDAFRNGAATIIGRCTTCEWPWTPAHGDTFGHCRVPPLLPVPGEGMRRSG
jgi:hypothetical protein